MTQFHEGQEVEVYDYRPGGWCKAKIVGPYRTSDYIMVEFPDSTRAVFDAEHIRPSRAAVLCCKKVSGCPA